MAAAVRIIAMPGAAFVLCTATLGCAVQSSGESIVVVSAAGEAAAIVASLVFSP